MNILHRSPGMDYGEDIAPGTRTIKRDDLIRKLQESSTTTEQQEREDSVIRDGFYAPLPLLKKIEAKNCLSIDVGTDQIEYLLSRQARNCMQVRKWEIIKLDNEEGDRYLSIELALKYIKSKIYRPGTLVKVSFFSPDINIRQVVVPKLKQADLENSILYKNKTELTNFTEDAVWKYEVLETFKENNLEKVRLLVTVIPADVIDIYLSIFKRSGLKPDSLIPRPFAYISAYRKMLKDYSNDVVIDINTDTTQVCFFVNGKLMYIRNFAIGANNLEKTLSRSGNGESDDSVIALKPHDEEQQSEETSESNIRERLFKKIEILKSKRNPLLQVLLGEILRSIEFFQDGREKYPIQNVYLTGAGLKIDAVFPYLKNHLNYPVYRLSPRFMPEEIMVSQFVEYFAALGAGLYQEKKMNMVSSEFKINELFKKLSVLLVAFFFLLVPLVGYQTHLKNTQVSNLHQQYDLLEKQYDMLNPTERIYEQINRQIKQIEARKKLLVSPVKSTPELLRVMKFFSNEVPPEIRLTSLRFNLVTTGKQQKNNKKKATSPENNYKYRISMIGQVVDDYFKADVQLINFLNKLNDLKFFKSISLVKKRKQAENKLFEFELEAFL